MGDRFIEIRETSLWLIICQVKNQVIRVLNEMHVENLVVSIFEEIQNQTKSLQQLRFLLCSKFIKSHLEDPRGKSVNKEHEPDSQSDAHELSICPYNPKEILEFEFNELDFEETESETLENRQESSLSLIIDQDEDLKEHTFESSFDLSIFKEDEMDSHPDNSKNLIEHLENSSSSENAVTCMYEQVED